MTGLVERLREAERQAALEAWADEFLYRETADTIEALVDALRGLVTMIGPNDCRIYRTDPCIQKASAALSRLDAPQSTQEGAEQ